MREGTKINQVQSIEYTFPSMFFFLSFADLDVYGLIKSMKGKNRFLIFPSVAKFLPPPPPIKIVRIVLAGKLLR